MNSPQMPWASVEAMGADAKEFELRTGCQPTFDQLIRFRATMDRRIDRADAGERDPQTQELSNLSAMLAAVVDGLVEFPDCELDLAMAMTSITARFEAETLREMMRHQLEFLQNRVPDRTIDELAIDLVIEIRHDGSN
jgi:hypothetical protein